MKAEVKEKLTALSASKKKLERAYISTLTAHLKSRKQKEANTPKRSRGQEIIKLRAEINNNNNNKKYTKNQTNRELVL